MANETVAAGVSKVLAAAKSIRNRYATRKLTSLLAADRKAIEQGLIEIGDADVPFIITSSKSNATPLPGAPAASDTLAPNAPTGLTVVADSTSLTWSWDASFDRHDGSVSASGVKEYDLEIDGVSTTVSTANANALSAPTFATIGGVTPPPSISQVGDAYTMTCAGTGIDGTADQCAFLYWSVSGNFKLNVRVDSFTGAGYEYAMAGLMVRESTAPGSVYVSMYQWLSALSKGVQHKKRVATDGARTSGLALAGNNEDRWLQIERTGSTFTYRYSEDGGTWLDLASETVSMNSAVLIGAFACDLQVSPVVLTAVFLQLGYTQSTRPSYVQSTTGTHTARVRARDLATPVNISAWSPSVSGTVVDEEYVPVSWNVGHYAFPDAHMFPSKYSQIESEINSLVTPTDKRDKVKGAVLLCTWAMLNPVAGTYDFTKLDYFINYCKTRSLRVCLYLSTRRYGGSIPGTPQADYREAWLPDYVIDNGWAGLNTDDLGGYSARFDITACTDAYLTFIAALGAHLNSEPYFEIVCSPELSAAFKTGQGFSQSNWNTQWLRFPAAFAAAFPNKLVAMTANYHSSVSTTNAFVDECITQGVSITGPDIMPQNNGTTDDHWGFMHLGGVGVRTDPTYGPYDFGSTNLQGKVSASCGQQVIQDTSFTPATIYSHGYNVYYLDHIFWTMHPDGATTRGGTPVPAMEWDTGVWPYLRDNSATLRNSFPTRLTELGKTALIGGT